MSTCDINAKVINKNNEYVDSILFKDLMEAVKLDSDAHGNLTLTGESNREIAKKLYMLATTPDAVQELGSKARFDENGQLTLASALSYAKKKKFKGLKSVESRVLEVLNKKLGAGLYEFNEAVEKIALFNRSNAGGKYMATLNRDTSDKYEIKVERNTRKAEKRTHSLIYEKNLKDVIAYRLASLGFDIQFIGDDTVSITDVVNGMTDEWYTSPDVNMDEIMARKAAEVIAGLTETSTVFNRLRDAITHDLIYEVLGEDYDTTENKLLETAIRLIADEMVRRTNALSGETKGKDLRYTLATRVADYVKRKFSKLRKADVLADRKEARQRTDDIISHLLDNTDSVYSERLDHSEEKVEDVNLKVFKSIVKTFAKLAKKMETISDKYGRLFKELTRELVEGREKIDVNNMFDATIVLQGIYDSINILQDQIWEDSVALSMIDIDGLNEYDDDYLYKSRDYAKILRKVRATTTAVLELKLIILDSTDADASYDKRLKYLEEDDMKELRNLNKEMSNAVDTLMSTLMIKERALLSNLFASHLGLGKEYVEKGKRVLFDIDLGKRRLIRTAEPERVLISDALTNLESDLGLYERYLNNVANSSDIIIQITDKMIKLANKKADDNTNKAWNELRRLESTMKEAGIDNPREIFETMDDGEGNQILTGNIINDLHWGRWEANYDEFRKNLQQEFLIATPEINTLTDIQKGIRYESFANDRIATWHKENSKYDATLKMMKPNNNYINEDYVKNIQGTAKEAWIEEYLNLKWTIEEAIPEGSMRRYRAPQFKGRVVHQTKNRLMQDGIVSSLGTTLRNKTRDTFVVNSEDYEFGSLNHYARINDSPFIKEAQFELDKMNRLPLYGINKLDDINELSTDIFHSTLSYASMAYTYEQMNNIVDAMEVGQDVLQNRVVEGTVEKNRLTSRSFKRYTEFLENNVYGIGVVPLKRGDSKRMVTKLASFINKLGGIKYLGGNLVGGMANVLQGNMEMFKEAMAGEFITMSSHIKANAQYMKYAGENMFEAGSAFKTNKMSLMIKHFNISQSNRQEYRDYHPSKWKLQRLNPVGDNLFVNYKIGEDYMQGVGFLSVMNTIQAYDKDGKKIDLFDAYYVDETEVDRNNQLTLKLKEGTQIMDKETGKLREWTLRDESELMDVARELNNRMQGIYNALDRVAAQRFIFSKMMLSMRGYALGMIIRRFGREKYSVILGKEVEGSLMTTAKVLSLIFDRQFKGSTADALRMLIFPYTSGALRKMIENGFSSHLIANMKRNFYDVLAIAAIEILRMMFAKGAIWGDDDDDEELVGLIKPLIGPRPSQDSSKFSWNGVTYFFLSRLLSEQSAYNTIWGARTEIAAVTNLMPIGVNALLDLTSAAWELATLQENSKGELKGLNRLEKSIPYYKSWLTMQDPYKASKSYMYGRVTLRSN